MGKTLWNAVIIVDKNLKNFPKVSHFSYLLSEVLNSKVIGNDKEKIEKFIRHFAWFLNHCGFALKYRQ